MPSSIASITSTRHIKKAPCVRRPQPPLLISTSSSLYLFIDTVCPIYKHWDTGSVQLNSVETASGEGLQCTNDVLPKERASDGTGKTLRRALTPLKVYS